MEKEVPIGKERKNHWSLFAVEIMQLTIYYIHDCKSVHKTVLPYVDASSLSSLYTKNIHYMKN